MVNNAVIDYPDRKVTNGVIHVIGSGKWVTDSLDRKVTNGVIHVIDQVSGSLTIQTERSQMGSPTPQTRQVGH